MMKEVRYPAGHAPGNQHPALPFPAMSLLMSGRALDSHPRDPGKEEKGKA
jgi:hypothetical protein